MYLRFERLESLTVVFRCFMTIRVCDISKKLGLEHREVLAAARKLTLQVHESLPVC
jgi:hypothetical protein